MVLRLSRIAQFAHADVSPLEVIETNSLFWACSATAIQQPRPSPEELERRRHRSPRRQSSRASPRRDDGRKRLKGPTGPFLEARAHVRGRWNISEPCLAKATGFVRSAELWPVRGARLIPLLGAQSRPAYLVLTFSNFGVADQWEGGQHRVFSQQALGVESRRAHHIYQKS
jgi:hypothetical protein